MSQAHKDKISASLKKYHASCKKKPMKPKKQAKNIDDEIKNLMKQDDKNRKKKEKAKAKAKAKAPAKKSTAKKRKYPREEIFRDNIKSNE